MLSLEFPPSKKTGPHTSTGTGLIAERVTGDYDQPRMTSWLLGGIHAN